MRTSGIGWMALLGGVSLFSTVEVASKIIGPRVPPFQLVFLRFFVTGLILLAIAIPGMRRRGLQLRWRDWGIFAFNGLIGIGVSLSLFHWAILVMEKAASCAIVFSANPVFVVLFARFINHEPWNMTKLLALTCGLAGISFFALESGGLSLQSLGGLLIMTMAALCFALSICVSRRVIGRHGVFLLMGASALFGSLFVLPPALFNVMQTGFSGLTSAWLPVLWVVLPGTALAYALYYLGLSRGSAYRASMTFFLKPALAALLAYLILNEAINRYMIIGTLFILLGLAVTVGNSLNSGKRNSSNPE